MTDFWVDSDEDSQYWDDEPDDDYYDPDDDWTDPEDSDDWDIDAPDDVLSLYQVEAYPHVVQLEQVEQNYEAYNVYDPIYEY